MDDNPDPSDQLDLFRAQDFGRFPFDWNQNFLELYHKEPTLLTPLHESQRLQQLILEPTPPLYMSDPIDVSLQFQALKVTKHQQQTVRINSRQRNSKNCVFKRFMTHVCRFFERDSVTKRILQSEFLQKFKDNPGSKSLVHVVLLLCWIQWKKPQQYMYFIQHLKGEQFRRFIISKVRKVEREEIQKLWEDYYERTMKCLEVQGLQTWMKIMFLKDPQIRYKILFQEAQKKFGKEFREWIEEQRYKEDRADKESSINKNDSPNTKKKKRNKTTTKAEGVQSTRLKNRQT